MIRVATPEFETVTSFAQRLQCERGLSSLLAPETAADSQWSERIARATRSFSHTACVTTCVNEGVKVTCSTMGPTEDIQGGDLYGQGAGLLALSMYAWTWIECNTADKEYLQRFNDNRFYVLFSSNGF